MRHASQLKFARVILYVALWCAASALPAFAGEKPRSLYDGGAVMFEQAHLIKPLESTNLGLATTHAPLLIQEVSGTNSPVAPARVYFQIGIVQLNGHDHAELTYWWFCNPTNASSVLGLRGQAQRDPAFKGGSARLLKAPSPLRSAGAVQDGSGRIAAQGVRITLNTIGSPAIFQVLGHAGSIERIFVSQSLESAALVEFGPALPGRRFAVERSLSDAPDIVVPRVIDDPPAVMGPILYLRAETHEVATLICRCMDSQAKSLAGQSFYELVPAGASSNTSDATRLEAANPRGLPRDFLNQTNRLSRSLRLPAGF